ncbi:monocarboxylate transporter 12-like [Asterias rubens]|uniref:monocarboxylate transporter 12-like n=1 Tax=Asterias rubens TaxID=7604 RepID=UPI0014552366|nr:monocarboxylate transporter 12-like [Asterias rubens]
MGVFIDEFVEYFECSTRAAGLVATLSFTVGTVTGIFVGVLVNIFGARRLMIVSGALIAVSFIMAAVVSTSLVHINLCFLVGSFGYSVMQTMSSAELLQYFPDNFASVSGISSVGGAVGIMILPPVVQQLIKLYDWRGALALLGAMSANYCVFAALVRPLRTRNSYTPIADGEPSSSTNPPPSESLCDNWRQRLGAMGEKIDIKMFVDKPGFVTTQAVNFLCGVLYCGWHIYLIPNGIALGFNETKSSFLATFGGFGAVFGRLSSGILIDCGLLQTHNLLAGSSFLLALVCLLDPIAAPSYEAVAALATLGGLCLGVIFPLTIVLSVRFPEEKRVSALSWMLVFFGTGMSAGSFLFGWIYDVTGDYGVAFCMMGVISAVMGVLSLTLGSTCFPCKARE